MEFQNLDVSNQDYIKKFIKENKSKVCTGWKRFYLSQGYSFCY